MTGAPQDDLYSLFERFDENHDGVLQFEVGALACVRAFVCARMCACICVQYVCVWGGGGGRGAAAVAAATRCAQEFTSLLSACLSEEAYRKIPRRKLMEFFKSVCSIGPGMEPGDAAATQFANNCRRLNVTP